MKGLSSKLHFTLYYWSLVLFAVSIHWMNAMMVIMPVILFLLWILQPNFKKKYKVAFTKPSIVLFSSIFFLSLIWLPFSSDFGQAFKYVISVLPIFTLSFVLGSMPKIPEKKFAVLVYFYIGSTVVSSIFNLLYFSYSYSNITDIRMISFFMSHIRYSLFIIIAIFQCYYYLFHKQTNNRFIKMFLALSFVWLLIFLFILQSITGIFIAFILFFLITCYKIYFDKRIGLRVLLITCLVVVASLMVWVLLSNVHEFTNVNSISENQKIQYTPYGNVYQYYNDKKNIENGNYVYLFICEKELRETWNSVSTLAYDGPDLKGQALNQTLIRYLTSKNLKKDRDGVLSLTLQDRKNIENGISNYKLESRFSLNSRVYQIIWEIDSYAKGESPTGHSLTQRFEFWRCAIAVISDHFFFGIGNVNVKEILNEYYKKVGSKLPPDKYYFPHNQYLTVMVRFGIIGLLVFLISLFTVVLIEKKQRDFLVIMFLIVILFSMINEDTLETQYGVILFSFWGAMLLFARDTNRRIEKTTVNSLLHSEEKQ